MVIPDQYKFCRWKDICIGFLEPELDPNCGRYHTTCSLATFMDIDENRELIERMRRNQSQLPPIREDLNLKSSPASPVITAGKLRGADALSDMPCGEYRPLPSWEEIDRDKHGRDETGKPLYEWGLP